MAITVWVIGILSTLALFLPVFSGYVLTFAMLVCQLLPSWRHKRTNHSLDFANPLARWSIHIWILLGALLVSSMVSQIQSHSSDWKEMRHFFGNNVVKYGLLWWFLSGYMWRSVRDFKLAEIIATVICPVTILHFIYCMLQRYYGFDWVHGWNAVIPDNRLVYGVYRVSGFSSHPLTLAYQLCFVTLLGVCLALSQRLNLSARKMAGVGAIFAWSTILISGSRGPLLVSTLSLVFLAYPYVSTHRARIAAAAISVIVLVLAALSGVANRFGEILSQSNHDTRTMDWRVYSAAFLDHPVFGLGPVGFRSAISAYYQRFGGDDTIGLAHNMYLQVAAESGVIGLLGYVVWILAWPRCAKNMSNQVERRLFLSIPLVMVLSALTQNSLRDSGVVFSLTFTTMILASLFFHPKDNREAHDGSSRENEGQQP